MAITTTAIAMIDDFLLRALLGGFGVALAAGPLGCFVLWRRLAYFGDALAHSALLGVALGYVLGLEGPIGVFFVALAIAGLLTLLRRRGLLAGDALLGILSHGALAAGVVLMTLAAALRTDLLAYLFGDILAVGTADLIWIYAGASIALLGLVVLWRPLLGITLDEDLARAEGRPVVALELALMVLMAVFVAVAMKVAGVLLTTALLVVPAATARPLARSPEGMAILAALAGCLAVALGLLASARFDTPAGPSMVLAAVALFALGLVGKRGPRAT